MSRHIIILEADGVTHPEAEQLAEKIVVQNQSVYDLNVSDVIFRDNLPKMKLIRDMDFQTAKEFLGEQLWNKINPDYTASDGEVFEMVLKKEFPPDKYFVLIDYLSKTIERDEYFRIRIWEFIKK